MSSLETKIYKLSIHPLKLGFLLNRPNSLNLSTSGIGYSSIGVTQFRSPKFMHTLKEDFFFITGTTILEIQSTYMGSNNLC